MEITIRPATEADIEGILGIVNGYAAENLMLLCTDEQIRLVSDGSWSPYIRVVSSAAAPTWSWRRG